MNANSTNTPTTEAAPQMKSGVFNTRVVDAVQSVGLLFVILIGGLLLSLASPVFFSRINIENLLFSSTIVAIVPLVRLSSSLSPASISR